MKKIPILIVFLFFPFIVFAGHVFFEEAQVIAENWAEILRTDFNERVTVLAGESIKRGGIEVAHVFHLSPRGYVIISAEDYLPPIKLYSLCNNFGKEGEPFEEQIFSQYMKIISMVNSEQIDPQECFAEKNREDFKILQGGHKPTRPAIRFPTYEKEDAGPLLTTTWNQGEPYNLKCPEIDGQRTYTGCVATAFVQVMKYFAYPDRGQFFWGYRTKTYDIPLEAFYDHPYHWHLMLDDYPDAKSGTEAQREAVAQLMLDVGIALETDYKPQGSSASPFRAMIAFPKLFKYSRDVMYVSRLGWNNGEWFDMAKAQVDAGLPVVFGLCREGGGHMAVIDGYRLSSGASTFHLNMGWGGHWDGYYSLNNIIAGDRFYTLLEGQSFFLDLVPPESGTALPSRDCGGVAYENRSLLLKEYCCELTWKAHPAGPEIIDRYDIIGYDNTWGVLPKVAEVDHTRQTGLYRYNFRVPDYTSHFYIILAVDNTGTKTPLMYCYLALKSNNE